MTALSARVLVVGGGPGGYVAAIRCGQLGLDTVLVEGDRLGGTCLIRGCIPSKALIHAADEYQTVLRAHTGNPLGIAIGAAPDLDFTRTIAWKDGIVSRLNGGVAALLKRAGVRVVRGWATFTDGKNCSVATADGPVAISAEHVILATGSVPVELPSLPFGGPVIPSEQALSLAEVPKRLVVVGAGYIGLELGIAFRKLGAEVTVVERQAGILPTYDRALVAPVAKWLARNGVTVHMGATAKAVSGDALVIADADGQETLIPADRILVAVGRRPATQGWGIENMALDRDGPFIRVDDRCATSMRNVWAIGDVVGEPMLAHKASAQGEMVAEIIAGHRRRFAPAAIASVCFTAPEIVSAGLGPDDAEDALVTSFPFAANGRALSMEAGEDDGFVRIVSDRATGRILGVQAVGANVSELSSAFVNALEMGAVLEDIAGMIHVHPTLGEAFHETALRALGHAIHI